MLHLEPRTFTNFGKSWATHNLMILVPVFYLTFLGSNLLLVMQERQIGGTSRSAPPVIANGAFRHESRDVLRRVAEFAEHLGSVLAKFRRQAAQ